MKKTIILAILVFTFGLSVGFAQNLDDCVTEAWVTDKDKKGLNVRDRPNGKIIGKIPFADDDDKQTIVRIVDYANGWLKIRKAETINGNVVFEGFGWVSAKKVTANVQTPTGKPAPLYARANSSSKKIGTIPSDTLIEIIGYECFGLKVRYKGKLGWLPKNNICGNPVTTCS